MPVGLDRSGPKLLSTESVYKAGDNVFRVRFPLALRVLREVHESYPDSVAKP